LLPYFLASGIVPCLIGVAMIVWALGHIESRHGPVVFLLLGVLSFCEGAAWRRLSCSP
jgi:hypothetical protein